MLKIESNFYMFQNNIVLNIEFPFGIVKIYSKIIYDEKNKEIINYYGSYNGSVITNYFLSVNEAKNECLLWILEKAKIIINNINIS